MTDPTPVTLNPDGRHSPEATRRAAAALPEGVRYLNDATGYHAAEALREPADADAVVVNLATMAQRLPQLLHQLVQWYLAEDAASRLKVTYGPHVGRSWLAVAEAQGYMVDAVVAADHLRAALDRARKVTATFAPAGPEEDPDA